MFSILEIFLQWFGQSVSFPILAVDLASMILGFGATLANPFGKRILFGALVVLFLSLLGGVSHNYMVAILSVVVCGVSTMFLLGAIIGWVVTALKFHEKE